MIHRILHKLDTINPWHFLWINTLLSQVLGLLFNTIQSYLWWGFLSYDLLLIGVIDCLFLPLLITPIAIYYVSRASKLEMMNKELELAVIKAKESEESRVRESEARYKAVVEDQTEFITRFLPDGTLTFVNSACCRYFGITQDEFIGRNLFPMLKEKDGESLQALLSSLSRENPVGTIEHVVENHEGRILWQQWTNHAIFDEKGTLTEFQGVGHDITERKQMEESLSKSEKLYRDLFDNAPVGLGIADADGTLLAFNDAMLAPGKYTREDMKSIANVSALYYDIAQRNEALAITRQQGFLYRFPVQFKRKDGTPYDALLSLRFIMYQDRPCIQAMVEDVTDRKRAEIALRTEENRYRELFEDSPIALCELDIAEVKRYIASITDTMNGDARTYFTDHPEVLRRCTFLIKVIDINNAMLKLFGAASKEELKENASPLFHEESYGLFMEDILAYMQNRTSYEHESVAQTLSGKKIHIFVKWFSESGDDDKGNRIIVSIIDITELKRIEHELRESKEWFQKILSTMNEGFGIQDNEGIIIYVNEQICRMLECSSDELTGHPLAGFLDQTNRKILEERTALLKKGDNTPYELGMMKKNGETIILLVSPQLILDKNGLVIGNFATLTDITGLKRTEEALRESEARMRTLSDHVPNGLVYQIDTGENGQQRQFSYISAGVEQLHGITVQEALRNPMSIYGQVVEEDRPRLEEEEAFAITHVVPFRTEVRLKLPSGELQWRLFTSAPRRLPNNHLVWDGLEVDITERKQAEKSLVESREWFRKLVETMNEGLGIQDEHGVITYVNQRFCEMVGYSSGELIGQHLTILLDEENRKVMQRHMEKRRKGDRTPYDIRWTRKNGEHIDTMVSPQSLFDENGQYKGSFATLTDITERKMNEGLIRAYQEQLSLLNSRLILAAEAERRKIAVELHDNIGQILASAHLKLGALRDSVTGASGETMKHIQDLIEQSIRYTRALTFELCPPILYEMGLEAAVSWFGQEMRKNHGIAFTLRDDKKPKPLADEVRIILFQSIRELLNNIIKHSQATRVIVSIRKIDHEIEIAIEDNGSGFDASCITNGTSITSGFGLFSVRERMKNIKGSIHIDSAPGSHTKITLTAPLKND